MAKGAPLKKILFIVGAGIISGKEIVSLNLMKSLKDRGYEIFCITSSWSCKDFTDSLEHLQIPFIKLRLGFISKQMTVSAMKMSLHQALYLPGIWYKFVRIITEEKPDVIIHTNYHHAVLLYPVLSSSSKNIYHIHESYPDTKFYKWLFNKLSKKIDCFIGVSDFVCKRMNDILNKNIANTIYNGLNFTEAKNKHLSNYYRDKIELGIIGQIGEWKGHEDIIDAIIMLKEKDRRQIHCNFYGNHIRNKFAEKLKTIIKDRDLESNFTWKGFIVEQNSIYENLDIVCMPSRYDEPLGMTAIEAGLYSLPVIATSKGGLPEIIINGINGFLTEAKNPQTIMEYLKKFIDNRNLIQEVGYNHYRIVKEKFNLEKMTDQFEALFI